MEAQTQSFLVLETRGAGTDGPLDFVVMEGYWACPVNREVQSTTRLKDRLQEAS